MNEFRLDSSHDITVENGHFARILKDSSAVRDRSFCDSVTQNILCMMRTEQGEAFTNYEYGVPWFDEILDLPVNYLDVALKILREKISDVYGVKEILSLKLKVDKRNLSGTVKIRTADGEVSQGEF